MSAPKKNKPQGTRRAPLVLAVLGVIGGLVILAAEGAAGHAHRSGSAVVLGIAAVCLGAYYLSRRRGRS